MEKPFLQTTGISEKVVLAQYVEGLVFGVNFKCTYLPRRIKYHAYCDDFGPMSMYCIVDFIRTLDTLLDSLVDRRLVLCIDAGRRNLTNAVFLIGSYMILKQSKCATEVSKTFHWLDTDQIEPYRDATYSVPDFSLQLIDCWRGLEKGMKRGWVRCAGSDYMWGKIDVDEYHHYDDPANGDLQEVVPGKFVAFKGPVALPDGRDYLDEASGARNFSPAFYAEIFRGMGVSTVVQLNEPRYQADDLTSRGFAHHRLDFPDCTSPPDAIVAAFLRIVDAAPGAVAVHCQAGLGRTGTLIALYLMRSCGFGAREAMGWLRIMRPGSVIGEQQHYLRAVDAALMDRRRRAAAPLLPVAALLEQDTVEVDATAQATADPTRTRPAEIDRARSSPGSEVLAEQVSTGMLRRAASTADGRLRA
jgi:cell division cycle 14